MQYLFLTAYCIHLARFYLYGCQLDFLSLLSVKDVYKRQDVKLADISGPDGVPDGKIDDNDRTIKGQTTPKWIGRCV